jgi:lipopolysaccharide heptosyltransferase III
MKAALARHSEILSCLPLGARVLVIRLRSLGDVVLLTPALTALHRSRPDLRVNVAVEPGFAPLLEGNPAVENVLPARSFGETVAAIRRGRYSVVYNQHGGPRSVFYTALSGAPTRVGWESSQYSFFYNVRVPGPEAFYGTRTVHTVEHRLTQFYWTGVERGPIPPTQLFPQPDAMASASRKLAEHGGDVRAPFALLHPGATAFTKRWPLASFAEIGSWLARAHGIVPVVRLGPGDASLAEEARRLFPRPCIVLGADSLDLRELIALTSRAAIFIGNDSGPAHIAVAVGRPVVVIFGSSDSNTWRPWRGVHRVVQNDFPCNPCKGDRCYAFPEPRCILSVTADAVKESCASLLLTVPRIA